MRQEEEIARVGLASVLLRSLDLRARKLDLKAVWSLTCFAQHPGWQSWRPDSYHDRRVVCHSINCLGKLWDTQDVKDVWSHLK